MHLWACDVLCCVSGQNTIVISIPTVFDPKLAPEGKAVVHCYTAGCEPYSIWEGMDRSSPEYKALKEERAEVSTIECANPLLF